MALAKTAGSALLIWIVSLCTLGAGSAQAEGLTAYTCEEIGSGIGAWVDSHCEFEGKGNYATVAIEEGRTTEVEGNAEGNSILEGTVFGSRVDITCSAAHSTGHETNLVVGTEKRVHGTKIVASYSKCHAKLHFGALNEQCKVESISGSAGKIGEIFTNALTSTSNAITPHEIGFEVEGGFGNVAEFNILKEATEAGKTCSIPKVKVTVTGRVSATANTVKRSHLTFEGIGELKAFGAAATYTGTSRGYMKGEPERTIALETS